MSDMGAMLIFTGVVVVLGFVLHLTPTGRKDVNVETTKRGTQVLHKHEM